MRKLIFILIALVSFSQAQTIQYIGAPTTTVISRGNFRTDSIFYLPKRTKTPTDTAAFRYQISDSSLYYWTGYQWTKVQSSSSFASVDTNIISTRAWRQKGIDSVQYNVGLKVNISDTASMLSPYIVGSGTSNYFPKFNATRSVVNSKFYESNLNLLFNSTTPYLTTSGISTIENNGTSAALYVLKTLDTARAYISFGGANTMDINNLRAGDIRFYTNATLRGRFQTDGTFRLNSLTGTGSRIVVADANGVLSATSSATELVDTTLLSTRAYRQKGDDSLGAIIATKGSGTVTSVATGYGLSGGTITTTGTLIADTALVASRLRLGKVADSLSLVKQNVLTNPVTGTGTSGYIPKWNGTTTQTNSLIFDNGNQVLINTQSTGGGYNLRVNGSTEFTGNSFIGSSGGKVLMNYSSASPAELRVHNTAADNQQLILSNNGTYHTGFIASQVADVLSDSYAWGMFGGVNSYITGTSYAVGIALGSSVPHFQVTRHNNLNGGVTQNLMRITSAGEVFINTTTDAGAYTLQNNGALYNTGSAILAATSGSVGIGTESPVYKMHMLNTTGESSLYLESGAATQAALYLANRNNAIFNDNNTTNNLKFFVNSATRMTINSSGNVGIGTTSPVGKLVVVGASNNTYISIDNVGSGENYYASNTFQQWQTAGSAKMTLNSSGELLVGTTTDAGNYRVQVSGNAYVTGDAILAATSGNSLIGTTTLPFSGGKLHVDGNVSMTGVSGGIRYLILGDANASYTGALNIQAGGGSNTFGGGILLYGNSHATYPGGVWIGRSGSSTGPIMFGSGGIGPVTEQIRIHSNGGLKFVPQSAAPNAEAGTVYYDSDDNKLKVYNGTTWVDLH